jgi:hypothetical protein
MKVKLTLLTAAVLLPLFAHADTVRPAVAKYLQRAETELNAQSYTAALKDVDRAAAVGGLSAYESLVVAQLRGAAAAGAGEYALAAKSYQTVLASGAEPPATALLLTQAIAGFYAQTNDNDSAVIWVNKYVAAGGTDAATRALGAQGDYNLGHYGAVAADVKRDAPNAPKTELQLGALAAQKAGDDQAYFEALQALLEAAPSPVYWDQAISLVQDAPGFPDGLVVDSYRLRFETGTLSAAGDYEDFAERLILAGNPSEAKRVLDAGFASGRLNAQTDGGHAARLQTLANSQAAKNPVPPALASVLDAAILSGHGFDKVPGIAKANVNDAQAALARLWQIQKTKVNE